MGGDAKKILLQLGRIHAHYMLWLPFLALLGLGIRFPDAMLAGVLAGFVPVMVETVFIVEFGSPPARLFPDGLLRFGLPVLVLGLALLHGEDLWVFFMACVVYETAALSLAVFAAMMRKGISEKDFGPAVPGMILIIGSGIAMIWAFGWPLWSQVWHFPRGWKLVQILVPFFYAVYADFRMVWNHALQSPPRRVLFGAENDGTGLILARVFVWLAGIPLLAWLLRSL